VNAHLIDDQPTLVSHRECNVVSVNLWLRVLAPHQHRAKKLEVAGRFYFSVEVLNTAEMNKNTTHRDQIDGIEIVLQLPFGSQPERRSHCLPSHFAILLTALPAFLKKQAANRFLPFATNTATPSSGAPPIPAAKADQLVPVNCTTLVAE
jgi:hypothetical protein